jgi:hypothetical protein
MLEDQSIEGEIKSNAKNTRTVQTIKAHVALNIRSVERSVEFYK